MAYDLAVTRSYWTVSLRTDWAEQNFHAEDVDYRFAESHDHGQPGDEHREDRAKLLPLDCCRKACQQHRSLFMPADMVVSVRHFDERVDRNEE